MPRGSYAGFRKPVSSQNWIRQLPVADFLNNITVPNFAYATFALRAATVDQPLLRVRDNSTNFECDVFDDGTGNITDFSRIQNLSGGVGTTLGAWRTPATAILISRFYNQGSYGAGGAGDLTESAANQPLLYSAAGVRQTLGTKSLAALRTVNSAGGSGVLSSGVINTADVMTSQTNATFIVAHAQASAVAFSAVHSYAGWLNAEIGAYLPSADNNWYWDCGQALVSRISGVLANREIAAVYSMWRNGANMSFSQNGVVLGSTAAATGVATIGSSTIPAFGITQDVFCPVRLHWNTKISDVEIAVVQSRISAKL